jgi:predicted  nucleic acid-binding Zn-ribbon protein
MTTSAGTVNRCPRCGVTYFDFHSCATGPVVTGAAVCGEWGAELARLRAALAAAERERDLYSSALEGAQRLVMNATALAERRRAALERIANVTGLADPSCTNGDMLQIAMAEARSALASEGT